MAASFIKDTHKVSSKIISTSGTVAPVLQRGRNVLWYELDLYKFMIVTMIHADTSHRGKEVSTEIFPRPYRMDKCQLSESKLLNLVNEVLMKQLILAHKGR